VTSARIRRELKQLWTTCPPEYRLVDTRGRPLSTLLQIDARKRERAVLQIDNWVFVIDSLISWYVVLAVCFSRAARGRRTSSPRTNIELGSFFLVLGAIVNYAIAISRLCAPGFDLPAKQVLRSLIEYTELLTLFDVQPELLREFHAKQDVEDANKFWHAYLSKGKARKKIENAFANKMDEYFLGVRDWRSQEKTVLNAATHPSHIACFAAFTGFAGTGVGFLGAPTDASVRTLYLSSHALFETAILTSSLRFWEESVPNRFFHFNRGNFFHRAAKQSWPVILRLFIWWIANRDSPELMSSRTGWPFVEESEVGH
jgi:hypothetical protein